MAICSHVLITITILDNPLRISASDLLLPLLLGVVFILSIKGVKFIDLKKENIWKLLLFITIWMTYSLFNGYFNTGNLEKWSLINKYIGWFVLIAYFIVGVWIGRQGEKKQELFIATFIIVAWVIASYGLFGHYTNLYGINFEHINLPKVIRIEGLFANANAYGIACASIIILQLSCAANEKYFTKSVHIFTLSLLTLALLFSYSRSAWLGFLLALVFMISMQKGVLKYLLLAFFVAFLLHISIIKTSNIISVRGAEYSEIKKHYNRQKRQMNLSKRLDISRSVEKQSIGITSRIDLFKYGLTYWKHKPITGIGIGSYKVFSMRENVNKYGYQLHSSFLWILVEMGIIGICLFSALFINLFRRLLMNEDTHKKYMTTGIAGVLLVMLGSSVGAEVLYQRYLWILLGIGFSITIQTSLSTEKSSENPIV